MLKIQEKSLYYSQNQQSFHSQVYEYVFQISRSVMSDSLQPGGLQHARLPCPAPTPCLLANGLAWGKAKNIICINILNLAKKSKYVLYFHFDRLAYIMTWKARFEFRIFSNSLESK